MTVAADEIGVASVLGALPFDANTVIQRVLQGVVGQMMGDGASGAPEGSSPEDMIAGALGNWLSTAMQPGATPVGHPTAIETTARDADLDIDDLVERNSSLAAAVGACDCWGDDPTCPYCEGFGTAGWLPPDRRLFAVYVYPAVRALRAGRDRPAARTHHHHNQKGQMR